MFTFPIAHFSSAGAALPTNSIDFEFSSSQYLTISDANFGAYDRAKWAISLWYKRESTGGQQLYSHQDNGSGRAFDLRFNGSSQLEFRSWADGATADGRLLTTATYTDTTSWHHILCWFDSANGTSGDRMRIWHDGAEVTVFSADSAPTAQVFNTTVSVYVAALNNAGSPANEYDGKIYQAAFFSGALPAIGTLYSAGSPLNVSGLSGLWSVLDVAGGVVTHDGVLASSWTNNNTAVSSADIPT